MITLGRSDAVLALTCVRYVLERNRLDFGRTCAHLGISREEVSDLVDFIAIQLDDIATSDEAATQRHVQNEPE